MYGYMCVCIRVCIRVCVCACVCVVVFLSPRRGRAAHCEPMQSPLRAVRAGVKDEKVYGYMCVCMCVCV